MGTFDLVVFQGNCPACGHLQEWRAQYKHGYCRQHQHTIGDNICWFDPPGREAPLVDQGESLGGVVAVTAVLDLESHCGQCGLGENAVGEDAVVFFRDNVIERVELRFGGGIKVIHLAARS